MTINLTALQKQRRDTAANWTGANPTLLAGEIGIESDTNKIKIGDGSTAWTSLGYRPWSQISAYPIVNADVASAAAIAYSKLATLTSANIVLGSSANVATSTAVTGDVTISNTGVTAIAAGVIVNADINASAAIADTKLGTISTALKVSNSATTATSANTASAIVARDASGNFTAGTITANLTGTASNVTTNANLTGDVTSVGNATTIAAGVIVDADINASAAIVDTKLATIATAGKVSNSATTATSANTASAIVARDASGNFTAGTITATLTGNAATVTTNANLTGDITSVGNATTIAAGVIVNADVNASAAIAGTKVAPDFGSQTVITTGSALIGTATSLSTLYSGAGKLQAASNDATTIQSYAFSSTGVDYSATLELSRARNTQASPTIVANGDYIGQINFAGYNTNFQRGATIYALVDGEPGTAGDTTDMPGKLVFATTPNGSATPTTRMSIDASGNVAVDTDTLYVDAVNNRVAIGTTSPSYKLHVSGSTGIIKGESANATFGAPSFSLNDTAHSVEIILTPINGLGAFGTYTNHPLAFYTNNGEKARIDTSGRLLVGTSTSRSVQDFAGNGPESLIQIEAANSAAIMSIISAGTADASRGGTLSLGRHRNATVGATPTVVQSGDLLGAICFAGGDGTDMLTKGASIACQVDGTPGADDMPGRLVFSTTADGAASPTERMSIGNQGYIFPDSSSRSAVASVQATGSGGFKIISASATTAARCECFTDSTSTRYGVVFSNPNGIVGSISTNASATAFNTSSDYRLKENVAPVPDGITRLQQLKPSRFNFIADPDTVVDGFIAHEAQAVVPECVTGEKDAVDDDGNPIYQGIDQSKLVPLLTAALQEAVAEIKALKDRVTALESA